MEERMLTQSVITRIFAFVADTVRQYATVRGLKLIEWYHEEPRWLLRWETDAMREVEIRLEEQPGRVRFLILPAAFFGSVEDGKWHEGDGVELILKESEHYPFVDVKRPVDLSDMSRALEKAFELASKMVDQRKGDNPNPRLKEISATLQAIKDVLPPTMASEMVDRWRLGTANLDAIMHGSCAVANIDEVRTLHSFKTLNGWFFHLDRARMGYSEAVGLLSPYADMNPQGDTVAGFRILPGSSSTPTICALDSAVRILTHHVTKETMATEGPFSLKKIDATVAEYAKRCRRNGMMACKEEDTEKSLFCTFAALEAMDNVASYDGNGTGTQCRLLIREWADEMHGAVMSCLSPYDGFPKAEATAFAHSKGGPVCVSADHYALRIELTLSTYVEGGLEDKIKQKLKDQGRGEPKKRFLDFLKLSWSAKEAGAGSHPGQEADLVHTRFYLQTIRSLLAAGVLKPNELSWLNPLGLLEYVMSCYDDNYGGFAVRPGYIPSLYTTRAGVNAVKLLEILRVKQVFDGGPAYRAYMDRFLKATGRMKHFVQSCRGTDGYHQFPSTLTSS